MSYIYLLSFCVIHLPAIFLCRVIFRCHTSTCYLPVSYIYLLSSGVIQLPVNFRCHTSTCYFPISYINLLFSCVMIFSSWTVVILFYPAAHFTFSVGYKKFRTRSASKLVFKARKHDHVQPLLQALHWLPVQARIDYKLSTICHNFFSDSSPAYVSDLLTVCRQLRSSADTRILRIPHVRTKTFGQRSFSYCAPKLWNSLPSDIRHSKFSDSLKTALKTHLYKQRYKWFTKSCCLPTTLCVCVCVGGVCMGVCACT